MKRKFTVNRLQLTVFVTVLTIIFLTLYPIPYTLYPIFAQPPACGPDTHARSQGLVTAPAVSGKFPSSQACIVSDATLFAPFKIPSFDDLKSIYFDQSKLESSRKIILSGDQTQTVLPLDNAAGKLYYIQKTSPTDGNLTLGGSISGPGLGIIFVDKDLTVEREADGLGSGNLGLVFIVRGNIIIDPAVSTINAVLISQGKIYTAGDNCSTNQASEKSPGVAIDPLTINGSIISLNQTDPTPIRFCRTLFNNSNPAEIINHQPKYLVILREILSYTLQTWSEVP